MGGAPPGQDRVPAGAHGPPWRGDRRSSAREDGRRERGVVAAAIRDADAEAGVAPAHENAPVPRAALPRTEDALRCLVAPRIRRPGDHLATHPERDASVA